MAETLWATSHITGNCPNPGNANGVWDAVWAGPTANNSGWTSRWAIGDPSGELASGAGLQAITVRVRKNSAGATDPPVSVNLYQNGVSVASLLTNQTVTSATSQDFTGTFDGSLITDATAVEVEVVGGTGGGSPAGRGSVQLDGIQFVAEVAAASTGGTMRRWTGSAFVPGGTLKRWTGSVFASGGTLRRWTGTSWEPPP
jgi:hypothetical protein